MIPISPHRPAPEKRAKDPICGMEVDPESAAETVDWNGQRYFF